MKTHHVLLYFRDIFNEYRRNLPSYFDNETPLLWTFHPNIIFSRTDLFIRRLQIIEVTSTSTIFLNHRDVNIGRKLTFPSFVSRSTPSIVADRSGFSTRSSNSRNWRGSSLAASRVDCSALASPRFMRISTSSSHCFPAKRTTYLNPRTSALKSTTNSSKRASRIWTTVWRLR